jgi:hypothetical protein
MTDEELAAEIARLRAGLAAETPDDTTQHH